MARAPRNPTAGKPINPIARADRLRQRKAGAMKPKKGKGTPYERTRGAPDPGADED